MARISFETFADDSTLARHFAAQVADQLRAAITARGHALLAVSGGNTPKVFFDQLSQQALDWEKLIVTLVDERWVPDTDQRSNARLVKQHLLKQAAAAAQFVPLYVDAPSPEAGLAQVEARVGALPFPFDVVILGMGPDGHTASFFPHGDHLAAALDLTTAATVLPMRAPNAGEPRITFSLQALLRTRALYLHIEGEDKRGVLELAQRGEGAGAAYPIRAVLEQTQADLTVFWCP